ncbi:biotin--[acetyl-CoA-carboxylase] ligase [Flavobacterium sp.]|uniref:biotin--[acetyl-CoA-carboxylase] ligase n=1 Tax=Flavobacterium sp. TaxID=239 RepID=UPI002FD9B367
MHIIKLNAINSTNHYLKELSSKQLVENFTIVVAKEQYAGKGQMGTTWVSDGGKNLTFSILIKDLILEIQDLFTLNATISIAICHLLKKHSIPNVSIKWPNDIMSGSKKVGGILIENTVKTNGEFFSIVGVGLNVNQTHFDDLPKASSLALVSNRVFDTDELLVSLCNEIKRGVMVMHQDVNLVWKNYHTLMFRIDLPSVFKDLGGNKFMGIIKEVTHEGKLKVLLEDDTFREFGIKEVTLLY